MVYAIQNPVTGEYSYPPQGRCWSLGQDQMLYAMCKWCEYELRDLKDYEERANICNVPVADIRRDVMAITVKEDLSVARQKALTLYKAGPLPEFFFSKNGTGTLSRKAYLQQMGGRPVTNLWNFDETGHTDEASRLLKTIFGGTAVFETPKPPRLIERILQIASEPDSIVLDSFAGSGTTGHAVLNMNKADGGKRKFILVEMGDYAESITAERVKRVIRGYGTGKNEKEGTGGDFSYYELGEPLLIGENLNEAVGTEKIREYVWYTETKQPFVPKDCDNPYYLGKHNDTGYYFYYEKQRITMLDYDFLSTVTEKTDSTVIYADRCSISEDKLIQMGIVFKKIPRDISKI